MKPCGWLVGLLAAMGPACSDSQSSRNQPPQIISMTPTTFLDKWSNVAGGTTFGPASCIDWTSGSSGDTGHRSPSGGAQCALWARFLCFEQ